MILSDRDIKERLKKDLTIDAISDEQIQAAWIDMRLGNDFRIFRTTSQPFIDVHDVKDYTESIHVDDDMPFIVHPNEFVLGQIKERIRLPADLAAYIDGRSSLGRIGIVVHVTSGYVDPGFEGVLVLEMTNVGKMPVALYPGMRICKLVFFKLSSPAERPYFAKKDAKYKDQEGVVGSRIHKEYKE